MTIIPGHRLLPPASILEKFQADNPDAGRWIMDKTQRILADRQEQETAGLRRQFRRLDRQAFLDGMATIFNWPALFSPALFSDAFNRNARRQISPVEDRINHSWARVGNALRGAMTAYATAHDFDLARLTSEERKGLEYLDIPERKTRFPFSLS